MVEEGPIDPKQIIPSSALLGDAIHGSNDMILSLMEPKRSVKRSGAPFTDLFGFSLSSRGKIRIMTRMFTYLTSFQIHNIR